jgi:hypothetical protein
MSVMESIPGSRLALGSACGGFGVGDAVQRDDVDRTAAIHAKKHWLRARSLTAGDGKENVLGLRIDGEVGNGNLLRGRSEQGSDLLVNGWNAHHSGSLPGGRIAQLQCVDRGRFDVGRKQDSIGAKGERSPRLELRTHVWDDGGRRNRRGHREADRAKQCAQHEKLR